MTRKVFLISLILISFVLTQAQSRRNIKVTDEGGTFLNVIATREKETGEKIKLESLRLYENGIEQKIKNFSFDPSPSKIVLLVDNSQTIKADVEKLQNAVKEFSYEIFEGDQLFVIGFDEKPEIIQEWTDDAKKIETSLATFRKQGNPYLFDALSASVNEVLLPLMPGTRKTAIVLISDGLDRGSKTDYSKILAELQLTNITVYALQLPDRTGGAYRRNSPKAPKVIEELTEGTGGKIFDFEDATNAAKTICDELRNNRYILSYFPTNTSTYDARRLLLLGDETVKIRTKAFHPPNVK
ncbi:MAG: VWA domain-containing protein [Pyrinomonadaceae bacterium]|jgi:Ca-activated chloride channel family protein|nr:VWA domain-containing protein [Pyrinomonadaceae bacterium]